MEFSKIITLAILGFHGFLILVVGAMKVRYNIDLEFLLGYTMPLAISMTGVYGLKSGVENYQKIKLSSNQENGSYKGI